ncbi:O-Antigen ligase [compost metagenome]
MTTPVKSRSSGTRLGDFLLVLLPLLPFLSGEIWIRWLGIWALSLTGLALFIAFLRPLRASPTKGIQYSLIGLLVVGIFSTKTLQFQTINQVVQIGLVIIAVRVVPVLPYTKKYARLTRLGCMFLSIFALIDLIGGFFVLGANANLYGIFGFCWGALILTLYSSAGRGGVFRAGVAVAFPLLLIIFSGSRASLLAAGAAVLWFSINRYIKARGVKTFLSMALISIPLVILVGINLDVFESFREILPTTGEKTTFSSRDVIWKNIFFEVVSNDYVGFGLGSSPANIQEAANEGLSAHNGFMQVFYQFGAIGLLFYLTAFFLLLKAMRQRPDRGVSAAILVGGITLEMFEVVMIQNHFGSGLFVFLLTLLTSSDAQLLQKK